MLLIDFKLLDFCFFSCCFIYNGFQLLVVDSSNNFPCNLAYRFVNSCSRTGYIDAMSYYLLTYLLTYIPEVKREMMEIQRTGKS